MSDESSLTAEERTKRLIHLPYDRDNGLRLDSTRDQLRDLAKRPVDSMDTAALKKWTGEARSCLRQRVTKVNTDSIQA